MHGSKGEHLCIAHQNGSGHIELVKRHIDNLWDHNLQE